MVDEVREVRETTAQDVNGGERVVREERSLSPVSKVERIIWYVAGVLLSLLAIRFVLSLMGANRSNVFADFIYGITRPFVAPFFGLFNYDVQYGVSRFEFETLVAIAVYALIAFGIARLVSLGRKE